MLQVSRAKQFGCRNCGKAATLLKERASRFHSKLLATAGETLAGKAGGDDAPGQKSLSLASSKNQLAMGGSADTLQPVVEQLRDLIVRLDQQAEAEQKHKDWCDKERSSTNSRKQHHAGLVSEFTKEVEDTKALIEDKLLAVQDNADAVTKADTDYADLKGIREKAHADYEAELQDYNDAISALGEATTMLTEFYSQSSPSMLVQIQQAPTVPGASEKSQAQEFSDSTTSYNNARNALVDAGNALTAELQTAQQTLTTAESNLDTSRAEVTAADNYLTQVSGSCDSLEAHFDDRKSLREQERQAITDAISVLNGGAPVEIPSGPAAACDISGSYVDNGGTTTRMVADAANPCAGRESNGAWTYEANTAGTSVRLSDGTTGEVTGSPGSRSIRWSNNIVYTEQ